MSSSAYPSIPLAFLKEAPSARCGARQREITREQSQSTLSWQDESLTSKTKVPVTTSTFPFFPPQTISTGTQVWGERQIWQTQTVPTLNVT